MIVSCHLDTYNEVLFAALKIKRLVLLVCKETTDGPTLFRTFNPLTPMNDQNRISPNNIKQTSVESEERCQIGDYN